jgi:hypothetical protein
MKITFTSQQHWGAVTPLSNHVRTSGSLLAHHRHTTGAPLSHHRFTIEANLFGTNPRLHWDNICNPTWIPWCCPIVPLVLISTPCKQDALPTAVFWPSWLDMPQQLWRYWWELIGISAFTAAVESATPHPALDPWFMRLTVASCPPFFIVDLESWEGPVQGSWGGRMRWSWRRRLSFEFQFSVTVQKGRNQN